VKEKQVVNLETGNGAQESASFCYNVSIALICIVLS
jgi:hypothetical protein